MKIFLNILTLARPINCVITFLSILIGAIVAGGTTITLRIIAASLAGAFITAYGNIVNDCFDIEIDRINKPSRPMARGDISRSDAIAAAAIFAIAGLGLSFFVHWIAGIITIAAIAALYAYTPVFKGMSYIGNILVAVVSSAAFIVSGLAIDRPFGAAFLVLFAFLLHLGREIVKDLEDRDADIARGLLTGATYAHGKVSRILASVVLTLLIVATLEPYYVGFYGTGYLITVMLANLIIAYSVIRLIITDSPPVMRHISAMLKLAMPLGLLAVLLGRLGY